MHYQAVYQKIDYKRYQFLRQQSGLSPKTDEAARLGMENSLCCVAILDGDNDNEIVGMGRIVGDGACHCQVVDICVLPEHQKKGLGKLIMQKLDEYMDSNLPDSCYVSLIADGSAFQLYAQYGFKEVWPASRGMGRKF
ncbi:GNAT family N-acetyltransferase [Sphingobacterium sp. ML3W]|uniref:GNAT family N-acetyltransferase n=1 Tax=Sphingobacterium sp. ML3W TaxID=1538644 RepID=UPI00249A656A|nr:GNAT family N-acetyltransferase [Sphingobacterium sp. ML3W]WFA81959.1 GNAT family N-acetyltransferase [Sphingobacterium sp. ML3W]